MNGKAHRKPKETKEWKKQQERTKKTERNKKIGNDMNQEPKWVLKKIKKKQNQIK